MCTLKAGLASKHGLGRLSSLDTAAADVLMMRDPCNAFAPFYHFTKSRPSIQLVSLHIRSFLALTRPACSYPKSTLSRTTGPTFTRTPFQHPQASKLSRPLSTRNIARSRTVLDRGCSCRSLTSQDSVQTGGFAGARQVFQAGSTSQSGFWTS